MFYKVEEFEKEIARFYNAPYAVATDCCTHAIELSLLHTNTKTVEIPKNTYLSIPMTAIKLNLTWSWKDDQWSNFYYISDNIIDAAVLWQQNSYIKDTFMCLSFQFKKHLSLGRGGAILCSSKVEYNELKKMSYDGRLPNIPWEQQDINSMGYHYYMTPETAQLGLEKLPNAINTASIERDWTTYLDLSKMKVFQ